MKILFYSIVLFVIIIIGIYLIKPDLFVSIQNQISKNVSTIIPNELKPTKTTIYKWTNAKGEPQFTNTAPPAGIKYTTEEVANGTNVMPSKVFTGKIEK